MSKFRFTEAQTITILREAEAGIAAVELCRKHGISDATFYNWRNKFGGMDVSEAKRLKRLVANQPLDIDVPKEVLAKN
uniref:transposase n=1 Tax=Chitinimonas taiwanensis TaxID=240412 RepID=UPI0035B325C8